MGQEVTRYIGRKEQIQLIRNVLENIAIQVESKEKNEDLGPSKELYFFYGEAGIGKTSLLKMLENDYRDRGKEYHKNVKAHFISLNFETYYTVMDVLIRLRKLLNDRVKYKFYDLDYLIYQYYSNMGQEYNQPQLPSLTDKLDENTVTKVVNKLSDYIPNLSDVISLGDIYTDISTALKNKKLKEKYGNISTWTQEEYEEEAIQLFIKGYNENIIAKKEVIVLEFDTFEVAEFSLKRAAWRLHRELFNHLTQTVLIMAGRNKPDLTEDEPQESKKICVKELLGFTNEEIWAYIKMIDPDMKQDLQEYIFKNSHIKNKDYGNPLYLAICKSIYTNLKKIGEEPTKEHFSPAFEGLVSRFLSYKTKEEAQTLILLATLKTWTNEFASKVMEKVNMPSFLMEYDQALKSDFIHPINEDLDVEKPSDKKYKMDKNLTSTISKQVSSFFKFRIAEIATDYYRQKTNNSLENIDEYIKWKLQTLEDREIIDFLNEEFLLFNKGPLKDLDGGLRQNYFLEKYMLDLFIQEVKPPFIKLNILNRRALFFKKDGIKDYISAIQDYQEMYDLVEPLSIEYIRKVSINGNEVSKEELLYKFQKNIAELFSKIRQYDQAYEAYLKGVYVFEAGSEEKVDAAEDLFFDSEFYGKSKEFNLKAANCLLEALHEYQLERRKKLEKTSDAIEEDIELLRREVELYEVLEDTEKILQKLKLVRDIRLGQIKQEPLDEDRKADYIERLFQTHVSIIEQLDRCGNKQEVIDYCEKTLKDGFDLLNQNQYKSLKIQEYLLKTTKILYKNKNEGQVFDIYKKIFLNKAWLIQPSSIKTSLDSLDDFINEIETKNQLEECATQVIELYEILIDGQKENEDEEGAENTIKIFDKLGEFYGKIHDINKEIELSKERIHLKEELKVDLKSDIQKLVKLLEKGGYKGELVEEKINLENLRLDEALNSLSYTRIGDYYETLEENNRMDVYVDTYDQFYQRVKSSPEMKPIQILSALTYRLEAFEITGDIEKINQAFEDTFNFYKETYTGTIEEKYQKIDEEADLNLKKDSIIKALKNSCDSMCRSDAILERDSYDLMSYIYNEHAICVFMDEQDQYEKTNKNKFFWQTNSIGNRIEDIYELADSLPKNKFTIIKQWEERKKEIADYFGEKSHENFTVEFYSIRAIYALDKSEENLSKCLEFLDESSTYMDKYELLNKKEELLRKYGDSIPDAKAIELYEEIYKHKINTQGEKVVDSIAFLNRYVKDMTERGLNDKALERLKNLDNLEPGQKVTSLKLLKLENLLSLYEKNKDKSLKLGAEYLLESFQKAGDKTEIYQGKEIYGNYLFRENQEKGLSYLKNSMAPLIEGKEHIDTYKEPKILENLINKCIEAKDLKEAKKLLVLYKKDNTDLGMRMTYKYLQVMYEMGDVKEVISYLDKFFSESFFKCNEIEFCLELGTIHNLYKLYQQACIYGKVDNVDRTKSYINLLERKYQEAVKSNLKKDQIVYTSTLGVYYKGLEEYTTALDYLEEAKEVTKKITRLGREVSGFYISRIEKVVKDIKESML